METGELALSEELYSNWCTLYNVQLTLLCLQFCSDPIGGEKSYSGKVFADGEGMEKQCVDEESIA